MSYILDALKKSEEERRRGVAPALRVAQEPAPASPRFPLWIYGLAGLTIMGAGMMIGWLQPWRTQETTPIPRIASDSPERPAPIAEPPSALESSLPVRRPLSTPANMERRAGGASPAAEVSQKPNAKTSVPPVPVIVVRSDAPARPPVGASSPALAPPSTASQVPAPAPSGPQPLDGPVPALDDLPAAIRQEMPKLSLTLHIYSSSSKDRLVAINDQLLHEGQDLSPDLKLEQITPGGVIMNFRGYRFRQQVPGMANGATKADP